MDLSLWNLLLADLIVVIHFSFILFVIFGGFLVLKWRKLIWLHLPVATWGALIEFAGWICRQINFFRKFQKLLITREINDAHLTFLLSKKIVYRN